MNKTVQDFYNEILDQLEQNRQVSNSDKNTIRQLAFNLYTIQECEKTLLEEGFIMNGLHGQKEHPAVGVKVKAEGKVRESVILLGLDFASQLKKKAADEGKDEWGDFA